MKKKLMETRLTEDETIDLLVESLQSEGYSLVTVCKGHQRGTDIVMCQNKKNLHIEVKGARGNPMSHLSTRPHFDSGQLKTHFGKAIVKAMDLQRINPGDDVAIAHPDDSYLRSVLDKYVERLAELGIIHYWVK